MIIVDRKIRELVESKEIGIENFSNDCVQPASYDLRIGHLVYSPSFIPPDKPVDLTKNGGTYVLPPYGNAILMTYETLKLGPQMIGRFGLKSGYTRRGLIASVGPQVDPGFEGKLFISLLNLFPKSHMIKYKDPFLTMELHILEDIPEKTYQGPYQGLENIGPDILEDLIRIEGLNLAQLQSQFSELSTHVKEWSSLATRFDEFLKEMSQNTKAISSLTMQLGSIIKTLPKSVTPDKKIMTRTISLADSLNEISKFFKDKKQLFYSDIAEELNLDYGLVVEACEQLEKEGFIEEVFHNEKKRSKKTSK